MEVSLGVRNGVAAHCLYAGGGLVDVCGNDCVEAEGAGGYNAVEVTAYEKRSFDVQGLDV